MATATETDKKTRGSVLIAVDGSSHSDFAVRWYSKHLHRPENTVLLLHVAEPDFKPAQALYGGMSLPKEEWEMMVNDFKKKENEVRIKYTDMFKHYGVAEVRFICMYGRPGETVVQAAVEHHSTMIVIGSRGLGSIRRTIMGSVSGYVLHHAHVPVVVCHKE